MISPAIGALNPERGELRPEAALGSRRSIDAVPDPFPESPNADLDGPIARWSSPIGESLGFSFSGDECIAFEERPSIFARSRERANDGSREFRYNAKVTEDVRRCTKPARDWKLAGRGPGNGRKGLHEAVGEEVKLHGCTVAESAQVDFTLALVRSGDTADEQG
jgi:hypothetical protein